MENKQEIQKHSKRLKTLADTISGEIVLYRDRAINVVIPKSEDQKELYIMTPAHKPVLDNLKKAYELLEDHIKTCEKSKVLTESSHETTN